MSPEERATRGIEALPEDLGEALEAAQETPFLRAVLGEHAFQVLTQNKRLEWERYRSHVSTWELERYLTIL